MFMRHKVFCLSNLGYFYDLSVDKTTIYVDFVLNLKMGNYGLMENGKWKMKEWGIFCPLITLIVRICFYSCPFEPAPPAGK